MPRILLVMPSRPLVLGHRGASHSAPENTVAAFEEARAQGADGVELDVRRTADGVLVVHHDPAVEPVGLLAAVDFAALRAACPDVPTLGESLAACAGLLVNVEVKCLPWEPDADPEHTVVRATIDAARAHPGGIVVSSFDLGAIDEARRYAPDVATGWLVHGQDPGRAARVAREHGHAWVHPDRVAMLRDPNAAVAACHAEGARVDVWTVDDPGEIRALAAAGVDAIITDVPDLALAALA